MVEDKIRNLQDKYVPDRRMDRFDVELKSNRGQLVLTGTVTSKEAKQELLLYLDSASVDFVDENRGISRYIHRRSNSRFGSFVRGQP